VDPDPGGPKTCGSGGSGFGSGTLQASLEKVVPDNQYFGSGLGRPKLSLTKGTNEEIFMFEESCIRLEASPGAQMSFVEI
jgi:hypothetical protein